MVPKSGSEFETSLRSTTNFLKKNKKSVGGMKKTSKKISVSESNEKIEIDNFQQGGQRKKDSKQKKELEKEDENEFQTPRRNTHVYISVSPRIFRKNIYHTHKLQREIIVHSKDNSKPIEFDPSVDRKPPLYLDIPNLYKRKRQELIKKDKIRKRYKSNFKVSSTDAVAPRYKFVPRPKTPKNYNPRPKSSNRYVCAGSNGKRYKIGNGPVKSVFKPKERYSYKPRPLSARNYHPRPKSGRRYNKRYSYPAPRKTVFKNNCSYKYRPRPSTPKNHFPTPKIGKRYHCQTSSTTKGESKSPYERRSVFKPKQRYSFVCVIEDKNTTNANVGRIRYVFPAPKKSVFKKKRHYKYNPRPTSPKNYAPKAKEVNRYICQLESAANKATKNKAMFRKLMLLNRMNANKELDMEDDVAVPLPKIDEHKTEASANAEDSLQETDCQEAGGSDEEIEEPVEEKEPEVEDMSVDITTVDNTEEVVQDNVQVEEKKPEGEEEMKEEVVQKSVQESSSKDKLEEKETMTEQNRSTEISEQEKQEIKANDVKLNEPQSKANEKQPGNEEVAESKGLWFNPELRKKIQVTAKGWELRGAA